MIVSKKALKAAFQKAKKRLQFGILANRKAIVDRSACRGRARFQPCVPLKKDILADVLFCVAVVRKAYRGVPRLVDSAIS